MKILQDFEIINVSIHPLYNLWNERKNAKSLCEEWKCFRTFLKDVGDRPSNKHRLARYDKNKPYGSDNFFWKEWYFRSNGETKKEKDIRRRKENPEIYKSYELKKTFGISYKDYEEKLKAQNYVCEICNEDEKTIHQISGELKSLAVDHCHKTNKIRGLLCNRCNRVLGKIKDDIELLNKMKNYLVKYGNN